jgi:DNA-binding LacI/PurR family transcriptional regulator
MAHKRRVTIKNVATAAGVSTTTVSDALNGRGRLPEATRTRIALVASELGYSANPLAKNLRQGKTGAIALYFPQNTLRMQYYVDLAIGAAEEALAHEYALVLLPATIGDNGLPVNVDGVVVSDPRLGDPTLAKLRQLGVPIVTCEADQTIGAAIDGVIESDHGVAMRGLLDHLESQGASRIAVMCTFDDTAFAHQLRGAYLQWCAEAGRPELLWDVPFVSTQREATSTVQEILALEPPVDAIISVPDGTATSTLQTVLESGLRVPEDILVAGYVDSPELGGLSTTVTAVDLSPAAMGTMAAALLADIIAGRAPLGSRRDLPPLLRIRASTVRSAVKV